MTDFVVHLGVAKDGELMLKQKGGGIKFIKDDRDLVAARWLLTRWGKNVLPPALMQTDLPLFDLPPEPNGPAEPPAGTVPEAVEVAPANPVPLPLTDKRRKRDSYPRTDMMRISLRVLDERFKRDFTLAEAAEALDIDNRLASSRLSTMCTEGFLARPTAKGRFFVTPKGRDWLRGRNV